MAGCGEHRDRRAGPVRPGAGTTRFLVNFPGGWHGTPVARPVGEALGLPAVLVNDARAFGLAELRLGAGRGARTMIGLTLGTGVGGVIAVDGRVHQGHDGTAGEIGHQTIEPDGPWCGCGNRGCLEAFARGDQDRGRVRDGDGRGGGRPFRAGDERARAGLAEIGRYLGIGIANMITVITPERVVIGGGVAAAGHVLLEPVRAELRRRVRTTSLDEVEVVTAELGTWAGAIGAAVHGAETIAAAPVADLIVRTLWRPTTVRGLGCPRRSRRGRGARRSMTADRRGLAGRRPTGRHAAAHRAWLCRRPRPRLGRVRRDGRARGAGRDGRGLLRNGVTSFLPTAVTAPLPDLATYAETVRAWQAAAPDDGAEPLGFNLEGPVPRRGPPRSPRCSAPPRQPTSTPPISNRCWTGCAS